MVLSQHSGSVYKHRSKNDWKETWLCLENEGKLTWKKKDAYEVKGEAYLKDIIDHIEISGWTAKKCEHNNNATPFLMRLPIEIRGSKTHKTLIVKNHGDLDLWLDAFATGVGKWRLWKTCKQRQAFKISKQKSLDERSVEQHLKYEELVEFYKAVWADFLAKYKQPGAGENGGEQNGHTQNGALQHSAEPTPVNRNPTAVKQQQAPNGSSHPHQHQHQNPPSHNQAQQQKVTTTVTVHNEVHAGSQIPKSTVANSAKPPQQQQASAEVFGEEDDGEEIHF